MDSSMELHRMPIFVNWWGGGNRTAKSPSHIVHRLRVSWPALGIASRSKPSRCLPRCLGGRRVGLGVWAVANAAEEEGPYLLQLELGVTASLRVRLQARGEQVSDGGDVHLACSGVGELYAAGDETGRS